MIIKRWDIRQPDRTAADRLAKQLGLSPLLVRVLAGRGFDTAVKIENYLAQGEHLSDPMALKDMDKAVARIRRALENGEKIAIYGDYDCDGMMATVLLYNYFEAVGGDISYYIPARDREGYGLNKPALRLIRDAGVSLVITVDNGITAVEEVEYASMIGLDVVITDHHKPRELLPKAAAVIDPHRLDDESGCEYLAGAGVAFKLVCALEETDSELLLEQYGELVAIATVADVVPLVGENRLIVRRGLETLQNTASEGLAALLEASGLAEKTLTAESLAYGLAPRINSAGRFDCVDDVIELLTSEGKRAQELAQHINSLNDRRRAIEEEITNEIFQKLQEQENLLRDRVLVVCGNGWHHGLVGIVAARMVERFGRPCIVLSAQDGVARGSARSVEGFSIIEAINACGDLLTHYGGHDQAAGMTLPEDRMDQFSRAINEWAAEHYEQMPLPSIAIDCEIFPAELTVQALESLFALEPYGTGNEPPRFLIQGCVLEGIFPIGDGKHLRLRFQAQNTVFYAVYFGVTPERFPFVEGERLDLAVTADVGEWNGETRVSVKIKGVRASGVDYDSVYRWEQVYQQLYRNEEIDARQREEVTPSREDIALIYRYLRAQKHTVASCEAIYARLRDKISSICKLRIVMDVLDEMQLIERGAPGSGAGISVVQRPTKVDLSASKILRALKV